ncbi:MAG: transglycosylase SLT domain-containing protein [Aquificae bacterium]|nr:transglycosylase SLT domain-containing protein [Aquificota bacterium]
MRGVLFLFLFVSLALGGISEKYKYYKTFLETKDKKLGELLVERYPTAPFINYVLYQLILKTYKEEPKKARAYAKRINVKKLSPSQVKRLYVVYKKLGISTKPLVLHHPHLFPRELKKFSFTEEERRLIGKKLFKARRYKEALRWSDSCYVRGVSLYRLGKFSKAREVLSSCSSRKAREFLLYAYLKKDMIESAKKLAKGDPYLTYLLGRELLERGMLRTGVRVLEKSTHPEARFYLGVGHYALGNYEKARESFLSYKPLKSSNVAKKHFWLFKTELNLRMEESALENLTKASKGEGFYATVAKLLLGKKVYKPVSLVSASPPNLYFELKKIYDYGFLHFMRYEAFKHKDEITKGDILLLLELDPYLAIRLAVNKYGTASEIYRSISHPTPFSGIVRRVSERFGVPAELIYAIMRQESLFDVYALSVAGAKGLMQLMDFTARWKAKRLGIELGDVYDPYTNILLGTAYLSFLMDYWDGDMLRVIASYNAGQRAVGNWRRYEDDFLFIELIPYTQTKNYTKKVLHNYYIYKEKLKDF